MTDTGQDPILVVDDDEAVREALCALLETAGHTTRSFASGKAFLDSNDLAIGACVILDIKMPGMDGLEVQRRLNDLGATIPVIIATGHGDVSMAVEAMRAGSIDFIEKPVGRDRLLTSLDRAIAAGESARRHHEEKTEIVARVATLTERERDVFEQLVLGRPNKVAAYELGISPRTIEIYRKNVMEKMGADSLSHLVRMAMVADMDPATE